ncbi:MAG: DNA-processing protein DprA [Planctomycetaceae bacterium]|nr:DNA-processing protein DprA [Planctomycetaceae bacterium]
MNEDSNLQSNGRTGQQAQLRAALALSLVPGVGPRIQTLLLQRFCSAAAVLDQSIQSLQTVEGVGPGIARTIAERDWLQAADQILQECELCHAGILLKLNPAFPQRLREIIDCPSLLYHRGNIAAQDELAIGIVGSRRCTMYGRKQAERLAGALARAGFTIISGLARGIDAAAHRGALNAGGRTIAVLATGVRDIYPPEHTELAADIAANGAVISEMPVSQKAKPGLFPQRNRIISGMSLGIIVIEAARNSGALYTARHALEQGREVFAVPGNVDSVASEGCHELIRDGVTLIRNADDVLAELGPLPIPSNRSPEVTIHNPRELVLNALESEVLNLITSDPIHMDQILRATQLDPSRVLATLTVLEMRRFIRRQPGGMFVRHD